MRDGRKPKVRFMAISDENFRFRVYARFAGFEYGNLINAVISEAFFPRVWGVRREWGGMLRESTNTASRPLRRQNADSLERRNRKSKKERNCGSSSKKRLFLRCP